MKTYLYLLIALIFISCSPGELINEERSNSYFINSSGTINYSSNGNWFELGIEECIADKKTFEVLSREIAKDKNHIFYCGIKQKHVDYKSFYIDNGIPKDKNSVYKLNFQKLTPIIDVEAKSFKYLEIDTLNKTWSKDKNHYYLNDKKINVDRNTFEFINRRFSKDKDSLYADLNGWKFISIKTISDSIVTINDEYIRDNKKLYYVSTFLKVELLINTFNSFNKLKILDRDVICINDKVIYYGKLFKYKKVDSKSFNLYFPNQISRYSKDKSHVYYNQEPIKEADPKTYKPLTLGFGKDRNHVFYENKLLKGVDSKTFKRIGKYGVEYRDGLNNKFNWKGKKL